MNHQHKCCDHCDTNQYLPLRHLEIVFFLIFVPLRQNAFCCETWLLTLDLTLTNSEVGQIVICIYLIFLCFFLGRMQCTICMSWPVRKPRNSHGSSAVIVSTDYDHWTSAFRPRGTQTYITRVAWCRINTNINIMLPMSDLSISCSWSMQWTMVQKNDRKMRWN